MVWYSHFFMNFQSLLEIQVTQGFGVINKAEVDVFLEFSFYMIQRMLAI